MKKNVFVLGAGRFGINAAITLSEKNVNITIIDKDQKILEKLNTNNKISNSLILDSSNIEELNSTAIKSADHVIVAMSNVESSIMTCVNLKDLGIKNITAKVSSELHKRILVSLGINDVVFPELIVGKQIAQKILSSNLDVDIIYNGQLITILSVKMINPNFINRNAQDLNDNQNYNIFAINPNKPNTPIIMDIKDYKIEKLDNLYITIPNTQIKHIKKNFGE